MRVRRVPSRATFLTNVSRFVGALLKIASVANKFVGILDSGYGARSQADLDDLVGIKAELLKRLQV
jgi:hypothetical protein